MTCAEQGKGMSTYKVMLVPGVHGEADQCREEG